MNRIYQGKVTHVEIANPDKHAPQDKRWQPFDLDDAKQAKAKWQAALWQHHQLFQDAVNYYLFCLAAMASDETTPMGKLRKQLGDVWGPFVRKSKRFKGLRAVIVPYVLPGNTQATIEDAFAAVLDGNSSSKELLQLAVDALVEDLGGDSAIQQEGRGYLPRLCWPGYNGQFPRGAASLQKAEAKTTLPALLHDPESARNLDAIAAKLKFGFFANPIPNANPVSGKEARYKFLEALTWLKEKDSRLTAFADHLEKKIGALPESAAYPAYAGGSINKEALKRRFFAYLLFEHVERSPLTFEVLRDSFPAPKSSARQTPKAAAGTVDRLVSMGDDPIKLARGKRGYVFPAFTSLPCWGGKVPVELLWSEFDIAAFKEALKTANQFRLKTEERLEKAAGLQAELDWMDGKATKLKRAEHVEEELPAVLKGDPRFEKVKHLIEVELAEEHYLAEGESVAYGLHPRTLRCYRDLVVLWNKKAKPGQPFSEEVYRKLIAATDEFQAENKERIGSVTLFKKLLEKDYWCLWTTPDEATAAARQKAGFSGRIVEDYQHYLELQADIARLKEPIRFTPADAEHSRRLFMFSDLMGRAKSEHVPDATPHGFGVDVSLAVNADGIWKETRVRLHYSAPRLGRDGLRKASGEDLERAAWLQPMMAALNLPEPTLQDFSKCALSLMPNRQGEEFRHLLNFPVSLDPSALHKAVGSQARWVSQFVAFGKGDDEQKFFLRWPREETPALRKVGPWWEALDAFTCLPVDLGQRDAGAYALLDVRANARWGKKPARELGNTNGKTWSAGLAAAGVLRLPGEDARVWRDGRWQEELSGEKGRLATDDEWKETRDLIRRLADFVADAKEGTLNAEEVVISWIGDDPKAWSFPELNGKLLRVVGRAQGWLARCHRWLWMLGDESRRERAHAELLEQERRPDWRPRAEAKEVGPLLKLIKGEIGRLNSFLPEQLVRLANRCAPLRGRKWAWNKHPDAEFSKEGCHLLEMVEATDHKPLIAGQRGLSLERIEQLEELRRRFQSLNRALQRVPGTAPKSGREMRNDPLPDCCPDILDKLDRTKEQRVNQTAHLIVAQALGVRLRPHQASVEERAAKDLHGEYEPIPGRKPVDFVVLEDLSAYLSSQTRERKENLRLMKWCHRQVTDKVKELCQAFGIPVLETPAAYSSKFCSRTGVAGFRAREIRNEDRNTFPWRKRLADGDESTRELFDWLAKANEGRANRVPRTLLVPMPLGPLFVPAASKLPVMQADINAAINLGLRAIAAPEAHAIHVRIRSETTGGQFQVRAESKREKARWGNRPPGIKMVNETQQAALAREGGKPNFFVDLGKLAMFDKAVIADLPLPLASGRGLWKSVRDREWTRCREINGERMRQWGFQVEDCPPQPAATPGEEDDLPM
jgi:hypothetical protein